ncbi:hypothetical protein OH799_30330 [Nocardia sp. NBC_00881]|uniref:hypothetical protein n=1 Tax=Nocardia sp. NBC_00881 TaxID=2975995 RepID=UPI00386E32E1|nr:hypothetical protein OH799_30330 [Nocardia sp. NBC_00881]
MVTSRRHTPKPLAPKAVAAKDRSAGRLVRQDVTIIDVGSMTLDPATRQGRGETVSTLLAASFQQRMPAERVAHVIEFRPAARIFPSAAIGARVPARLPS